MAVEPCTLTARWIFPIDQPPLADGTITIQNERILSVDKTGRRTADIDFGNAAILPGFVNAHTHLDLSLAQGQCPLSVDFTAWLRAVIAHRRRQTPEDVARAIDIGLSQCLRYGTTVVGDISAGGLSWERLATAPSLRAVVFYELLGLTRERARQALAQAEEWKGTLRQTDTCVAGFSPHSPYGARRELFENIAKVSAAAASSPARLPISIHLAETTAELQLLHDHAGSFVDFLTDLGVWDETGLVSGSEEILTICEKNACKNNYLFIHCNYLQPTTAIPGAVVYCPRTHAAFGHPPHPFREFLANGTIVALGTDSLASNPDLDILAEARFVHQKYPDIPGAVLLQMATLTGARALGFEHCAGSLSTEKSADLVVVPLENDDAADPHTLVLASSRPLSTAIFRGRPTYSAANGPSLF